MMGIERIIGRKKEIARLARCLDEKQSQLIIIYGRRRVGKTFIVNQFFEGRFDFKMTGAFDQPKETQLKHFAMELNRQAACEHQVPESWTDAFELLRAYLSVLPQDEKHVVFFDEMPWMDTPKSGFVSAFEWFWNDWGGAQDNLVFIVCGSATSWMIDNILQSKGGLFNRQTCRIYLRPFALFEVEDYLESRGIEWSRYDVAECYMVMGGIPYYLSLLDRDLTYRENVDNLFFRKRAELWDEFDRLYHTLFSNSHQYIRLAEILGRKRIGLSRGEIADSMGMAANGTLTKMMRNMMDSGFIRAYPFYGKKKRETLYQLSDYYTLFFFQFIKPNYGMDEHYWSNAFDNPSRRVWAGLTFEQLCKDHINQIKRKLGISGVFSEESTWFSRPDPSDVQKRGAQIDLIIDRRDRVVNICESKFSINEFTITRDYEQELRDKVESFRRATGSTKTLQLTLITTFGVKKNIHSDLINSQVVLDDLFAPE